MPTPNSPSANRVVFVCIMQGANRCGGKGSVEILQRLRDEVQKMGLSQVLITTMGCTDRHHRGPVMVVYPEEVWYGNLRLEDVPEIVSEHLSKGNIVTRLIYQE